MTLEQYACIWNALNRYTPITETEFQMALPFFVEKKTPKNDYFNHVGVVCKNLAFIKKGIFRIYLTNTKTGEEQNLFFFIENEFLVSIKSFLTQTPCLYSIEALEDSEIIQISHQNLMEVYKQSHAWETFGRKLAEQHFMFLQQRMESLLTKTAQERYEDMVQLFPNIVNRIPLYHISSYLGIKGPSLSRIRKNISLS
ncbi:MAG: Crp/Fnr family transcriptional regulator [Leadbetterella sp.]